MHIVFCITTLGCGGAERIITTLAKGLINRGHEVSIVVHVDVNEVDFYQTDPGVKVFKLGRVCSINASWPRKIMDGVSSVKAMRQTFREIKPDCIVAFTETINIRAMVAAFGLNIPVIISERNDPKTYDIGPIISLLRWCMYPHADQLVILSEAIRNYYPRRMQKRITIIGNPVPAAPVRKRTTRKGKELLIVSIGRLIEFKRMDMVIQGFAMMRQRYSHGRLVIYGAGPELPKLKALIGELQLEQHVQLAGLTTDPLKALSEADIFVFASRSEGWGNVITEAMVTGLPVLVTECGGALHEFLTHNKDGLIVGKDDLAGLAENMERLMKDSALRQRLGVNAQLISKRYNMERVLDKWEKCIKLVTQRRK